MSKMLSLGMRLDDVILASTHNPAKVIGCEDTVGSCGRVMHFLPDTFQIRV